MKKQNSILPVLIVGLVVVGGIIFWLGKSRGEYGNHRAQFVPTTENGIKVEAPPEVVDQQTGEVNQTAFEDQQQVSDDSSLDAIETELDQTVILEEDFSDL